MHYGTPYPFPRRVFDICRHCFVYAIFTLLTAPFLQAQIAPKTDSLRAELEKSTGEQRVAILLELTDELRRSNRDSAIYLANQALEISQRLQDKMLKAESLRRLGLLMIDKDTPEALDHLLQAKQVFEQMGDLKKEAETLQNLGDLYRSQSDYSKSLEYYFSALSLQEQLNDSGNVSNLLYWLGVVNDRMGQPEKSIEFYKRALELDEEENDANGIAMSATNLGEVYASVGQTEQALSALNKALNASEHLPGAHAKATILISMSSVYNSAKSYQQALAANNEALSLAQNMSDKMLQSLALENIASVYHEQGDYQSAIEYLMRAIPLLDEIGWQQSVTEVRNRIANNYFNIGAFEQSIQQSEMALENAMTTKAFAEGQEALQLLSESYQQTGDYKKALAAQEKLLALKDSSFSREQARQIAEMQTRYETKEKEQQIALLRQEQQRARFVRNTFAAGLLLILIIGLLVYNRQRLKIKKNKTELENNRLKEKQLQHQIEVKNKELTTHTLNLVQKNEIMKELKEGIHEIKLQQNGEIQKKMNNLENLVDYSFNLDEDWEEFKLYFEEIHTGFFETLKSRYPDLTPNELRLSALVKLNLTIKEIATIMGISPDSVKTARYRLRKKLGMQTEENLTEFMMNVEKTASA